MQPRWPIKALLLHMQVGVELWQATFHNALLNKLDWWSMKQRRMFFTELEPTNKKKFHSHNWFIVEF
jgi:hypothetical protein